ncbi:HAD family phosphatase [Candidatus Uhrbacteria bacterium]|nr:HAD family phosphatase [Candidatus Uhrbacteria bacterium]
MSDFNPKEVGFLVDMDGLLINSEKIAHEVFLTLCNQHGGHFNKEIHSNILGTESEFWSNYVVDHCKLDINSEVFLHDFYQVYREILDQRIALMPGVKEFLDWISIKGYEKCLVTSSGKENTQKNLKKVGLDEYFFYRITADVTSRGKPDPEPYQLAASLINRDLK